MVKAFLKETMNLVHIVNVGKYPFVLNRAKHGKET